MAGDAPSATGRASGDTPAVITNRPSLRAIEYRIGTYATFRRTMLRQIARWRRTPEAPAGTAAATPEPTRPLARWTTRSPDDFGIAFLEMWAYVADILTFYQERIANEAFLRTAVRPQSTTLLVSLIGYRPGPGRAAVAHLAFQTERDAIVELPAGLLVQSVPAQDEKPQKFETLSGVSAFASLNELRPQTLGPQALPRGATRAVLAGTGHNISPGDWVAIAGDARRADSGSERWDVRRVAAVEEDDDAGTTTVSWLEGLGAPRRPGRAAGRSRRAPGVLGLPRAGVAVRLQRAEPTRCSVRAPGERLTASSATELPARGHRSSDPPLPGHGVPGHRRGRLGRLVTRRIDTTDNPELTGYEEYVELYPVVGAMDTAHANYLLAGQSTRVTLDAMQPEQWAARLESAPGAVRQRLGGGSTRPPEHIEYFPIRGTIALIQSERIPLADVPLGSLAARARRRARPGRSRAR